MSDRMQLTLVLSLPGGVVEELDIPPTGWRRYRCRCGYRWETPRVFPDDDPRCRVCDRPAEAVTEAVAVAVTTTLPTGADE